MNNTPLPGRDSQIPILDAIAGRASAYDLWLTDIWGVIHNGVAPFTPACDACAQFRLSGGFVLLLSNAPRPAESVAAQLDRIGVPRFAWDTILSSGDAARALLAKFAGRNVFHLGPERDLPLFEGLGCNLSPLDNAEAVCCTGLFDDEAETPADYADMLANAACRGLPMICANPDLTVVRGDRIVYCAGALAADYAARGGQVTYAGKPHLPIYDMALQRAAELRGKPVARDRVLAIGDGIGTDIKGAAAAGLDSVFVASGVHVSGGLTPETLAELFPDPAGRPIGAMTGLRW